MLYTRWIDSRSHVLIARKENKRFFSRLPFERRKSFRFLVSHRGLLHRNGNIRVDIQLNKVMGLFFFYRITLGGRDRAGLEKKIKQQPEKTFLKIVRKWSPTYLMFVSIL